MNSTIVWGVAADHVGHVVNRSEELKELPAGGVRVERRTRFEYEPAAAYGGVHAWPMELRWVHEEPIGRVRSLRRAHGRLLAVAETELSPDELQTLAGEDGLKFSPATLTRPGQALRITEISLCRAAATVGLSAVKWYKRDVTRGNMPSWVREELERASKVEHRSALLVHEVGAAVRSLAASAEDEYDELGRELGLLPRRVEQRVGDDSYGSVEYHSGGRIISVGGRRSIGG